MISSANLSAHVRHIGFTPIEDFNGYLGACDIVLNLRYPTVGESSGTLLRSLGMGKAVIVSDVGSFREYPDEICLKAPVGASEEDHLFEYLNMLVSRPEFARALGARARQWVERECNWNLVAERYVQFLEGKPSAEESAGTEPAGPGRRAHRVYRRMDSLVKMERANTSGRIETRLEKTLAITPPGTAVGSGAGDGRVSANHARAAVRSSAMAKCAAATSDRRARRSNAA